MPTEMTEEGLSQINLADSSDYHKVVPPSITRLWPIM